MKTSSFRNFPHHSCERSTVRLARIATADTIYGGARALVLANACDRLGVKFIDGVSAKEIVSDVYSRSTGNESRQFGGWKCPECGQSHVGIDAAFACCQETEPLESFED